jgi:organic radical activating enzyme
LTRLHVLAFEINATWHCNLACVACTHASPVAPTGLADPDIVERDLSLLTRAVDVDEIRILGGEPLLHPRLPALLRAVRNSGVRATVRISTNGTRLHATDFEWLEHVDEVHVSWYPGTNVRREGIDELTRLCHVGQKRLIVKNFHAFRHAVPRSPLTGEEVAVVFETCQQAHAWSCHPVHEGQVFLCPISADPGFGHQEACPIEPTDTLAERLAAFLHRPEPLRACANCLGTVGDAFAHRQANAKTWLTLTRAGTIDSEQVEAVRRDPLARNGCSSHEVLVEGAARSYWVGATA